MDRIRIPIRPGGMLADKNPNDLGIDQHENVTNFKEVKEGEWDIVKGLINSVSGFTTLKAAAEVTDDLSGDRFIIVQDNTNIKRIDYDGTNSPVTGYENETPTTLNLPSGVTIGAGATCRFFVHNGVVRITGGSEPIWYGYIKKKLLYTGYVEVDKFLFEVAAEVANFTGSNATVAQSAAWSQKQSTYSMLITSTGSGAYAYRQITAKTKGKYRLFCQASKFDGAPNTDDWYIKVGTSPGAGDILETQHQASNSVSMQYCIFEFDVPNDWDNETTTIYISIFPETGTGSGDTLYIDNWLLQESYPQLNIQNWIMEKAALDKFNLTDVAVLNHWPTDEADSTNRNVYCKVAAVYDGGQYSLMNIPVVLSSGANDPVHKLFDGDDQLGVKINLRLQGATILDDYLNYRLTGILVIAGTVLQPLQESDASMVWKVIEALDFQTHPPDIEFTHDKVQYDTANPNRLELRDDAAGASYHSHWEDGYFQVGAYVHISRGGIQWISKITAVNITGAGNSDYIELEDAIHPYLFSVIDPDANFDEDDMWFKISRLYKYSAADGIDTNIGAEVEGGTSFWSYTSIPAGTIENTPDYTHHRIIDNIAFALSNEEDAQDIIRYSPVYQPDNLPILNIITTPVGDIDRNLALVERDGRFVTLKRKSVSQGQFTSSTYFHDKEGVSHGLYATEGYIVIDDVLYFMDIDDVYIFNGVEVLPLMQKSLMRSFYVDNVHTGSFFAYKPLDKELWMVLDGIIIVYDFERNKFYLRETVITPVKGFTDYNQRLFLFSTKKFALYDHNEATFDESIRAYFKTRLVDLTTPENYKFCHKIQMRIKSNADFALRITDEREGKYSEGTATPDDNYLGLITFKPRYLFKEAYIEYTTSGLSDILYGTIKSCDLVVDRWKGIK
jgi:hypothetical protein